MYEYIKGTLIETTLTKATVDLNGLGYSLFIPFNNYAKLPKVGTPVTFYLSFVVREDSQRLYGFLTRQERDLFESLIEVSGIGPKTGLALVGHMEIQDLQAAISQGHSQTICKIPGIGKKTAERLIIDMRDKIKKTIDTSIPSGEIGLVSDATSALINLGYNSTQAQKAVKAALSKTPDQTNLAQLITSSLHHI